MRARLCDSREPWGALLCSEASQCSPACHAAYHTASGEHDPVGRAAHAARPAVQHVGVDHGGGHVAVPKELLDRTNVVAILQQVGGEGVAEGMAGGVLGKAGPSDGVLDGALEYGFVEMVAPPLAGDAIHVDPRGGERPLPPPFPAGGRILPGKSPRQLHPPRAMLEIALMLSPHQIQMSLEIGLHGGGQHRDAVLVALAASHDQLA